MIRRLLATRPGFLLVLGLEALLLLVVLPRALRDAPVAVGFLGFWGLATVFYFSNYRAWRWLQRSD